MPNVTLHYTENVGTHLKVPLLLKEIHDALIGLGMFKTQDIKSRAQMYTEYRVGDGHSQYGFVHLVVAVMATHAPENRQLVGETLKALLVERLRPGLSAEDGQIRVEIALIDPVLYFAA
ncbi:5-carboxymethyl-2-hydroxymuconate Delta-isomerase [Amantichitinum ursilacus]|uniref:5-carboxymethyl-2-hydroxymuconate Delta-isomerase n=1 Tax=Amantichitinum ursilacus TaxID=857265 RepID=A0A0N0GKL6_9NEIS|nr:5-carboxymethyl-2-hydroxymuconate Delta-isomerase [Amantichitinum ursilacus]KPC49163.1 5-carboxymethyl-2-hydroxymuconate Delta-isomerase [Amantichitinum ursilacus]